MSVILADSETGFHRALQAVFAFNYPSFIDVTVPSAIPCPPLEFHDRHIDASLSLKCVKYLDFSLADYLSSLCEDEMLTFLGKGKAIRIPHQFMSNLPPPRKLLRDAFDVASYHVKYTTALTTSLASQLCLHPSKSLHAAQPSLATGASDFHDIFRAETGLCIVSNEDGDIPSELNTLDETQEHPEIAIYECLWSKIASTASAKKLPLSKGRERKSPLASSKPTTARKPGKGATVRTAHLIGTRHRPYRPEEAAHLQRFVVSKAWSRAVQNDATFIVFHCGKYERIGFRHRKTQTLYLSELIDPSVQECYGKMQIGLQIAILKDLLNRGEIENRQPPEEKEPVSSSKKRPAESDISPNKKRRKTCITREKVPEIDSNPSSSLVEETLGSRHLALFNLDYDVFRSPTPSSFIRVTSFADPSTLLPPPTELKTKASYTASNYFSLSIEQHLASGSIGIVHRASATFKSGSRTYKYSNLAVKLAFTEENQRKLRYEYGIYRHLAHHGVTENILRVYGLFQDAETGVLAIVMDYGGTSLVNRKVKGSAISCSEEEKFAFSEALKKLHAAGVLHGDIESQNLLIDSCNNVYFIDFHSASLYPEQRFFESEKETLEVLLGCGGPK
ncbi:hypothetical protein M413DRAFT_29639 [Hebeloma cylindrosporum]|uniref:Protein kinase domain-containing protein n=1 Tax=Hebeloma cylindrosporum TaxID=76867 RepID=A0A0C3C636_HEBCY|nr:hypothetical protein M413DRAFT_29639 [Hebeloma cylindrosporum h7]